MATLSTRLSLAPDVGADNAYIFLAADRLYTGEGLTATPPRAPLQPWSWHADWTYLTQWPFGYPVLLCAVRWLTGLGTAAAAALLGAACCGMGVVGWFAWSRACLPARMPGTLIALIVGASSFSVHNLVNPTSDGVLLAAAPWVLLFAGTLVGRCRAGEDCRIRKHAGWFVLLGFCAGALTWLRYAAVAFPAALGLFLFLEWLVWKRLSFRQLVWAAVGTAAPIAALLVANRLLGDGGVSAQEQFNLGDRLGFHFDWSMPAAAWDRFTRQTLYAHQPAMRWVFAAGLPAVAVMGPWVWRSVRPAARSFWGDPRVRLSIAVVATVLGFLILASVLFQAKYNYVAQARYYQPIRPLYFLLFVGPLVAAPWRVVRGAGCVPLVMIALWFVNQDARRTIERWSSRDRPATAYGRWAQHFTPNAPALFAWLKTQRSDELVVFSNFHEEIALETGIPACPTPRDAAELEAWGSRIRSARGVSRLRYLFVLHPDNDYRAYYLPPIEDLKSEFFLGRPAGVPGDIAEYLHEPGTGSGA